MNAKDREGQPLLRKRFCLDLHLLRPVFVLPVDSTCAGRYAGMRMLYVGVTRYLSSNRQHGSVGCRHLVCEESIRFNGISIVISRVTTLSKADSSSCEVTAVCPSHSHPCRHHACNIRPAMPTNHKAPGKYPKKTCLCACNVACWKPRRPRLVLFSRLRRQCASRLVHRNARAKRIGALPQAWPLQ